MGVPMVVSRGTGMRVSTIFRAIARGMMAGIDDLTGVVLAGGHSRRFGSDKSKHVVRGARMIDHVISAVSPLARDVLVSVRMPASMPDGMLARVVVDRVRGRGPLSGLHAALCSCATPWLLVVACDMPNVTSEALGQLVRRCRSGTEAVIAVDRDGRRHPLCACYHRSILGQVEDALISRDHSMHGLLGRLAVRCVALPEEVLRNVNRPDEPGM